MQNKRFKKRSMKKSYHLSNKTISLNLHSHLEVTGDISNIIIAYQLPERENFQKICCKKLKYFQNQQQKNKRLCNLKTKNKLKYAMSCLQ